MLDRVGSAVVGLLGRRRSYAALSWLAGVLQDRARRVDGKVDRLLDPRNPQSYVAACTGWVALALDFSNATVAAPKLTIGIRKVGTNDDPVPYVPVRGKNPIELLNHPLGGEVESFNELRQWINHTCHMFAHAAVAEIRDERNREVIGLEPLIRTRLTWDEVDGRISKYRYTEGAKVREIDPAHVWIFKNPAMNANAPGWGRSTFDSFSGAIELRTFIEKAQTAWFRNGARPGGILTIAGGESEWQSPVETGADGIERTIDSKVQQYQRWIVEQHSGVAMDGLPTVVTSDMKWEPIVEQGKEVGFIESRKGPREEIFGGFGVSPRLLGVGDEAADSHTALQARRNYQRNVLVPRIESLFLQQLAAKLNRAFPLGDPAYEWAIITENLVEVDFETELKAFVAECGGNGTAFTTATPRMWMLRQGYRDEDIKKIRDPHGQLDQIFVRAGWRALTEDPAAAQQPTLFAPNAAPLLPPAAVFSAPAPAPAPAPVIVRPSAGRTPRRLAAAEGLRKINLRAKLQRANRETAEDTLSELVPIVSERNRLALEQFEAQGAEAIRDFLRSSRTEFVRRCAEAALHPRTVGWQKAAEITAKGFGTKVEWKDSGAGDPVEISLEWLTDLLFHRTSTLIQGFDEVTADEIEDVLRDSIEDGGGRAEQTEALSDYFDGQVEKWRLRRDVETEGNNANNEASFRIANDADVDAEKHWTPARDSRVRQTHRDAGAEYETQGIKMSEKFRVGESLMNHPGDPAGAPGERYGCRCVLTYSVK